jgi:hypothetical protein
MTQSRAVQGLGGSSLGTGSLGTGSLDQGSGRREPPCEGCYSAGMPIGVLAARPRSRMALR